MNYMKLTLLSLFSMMSGAQAQSFYFKGKEFEISHIKAYVLDSRPRLNNCRHQTSY